MRLAIVIPTLDEEPSLEAALDSALGAIEAAAGDLVVVADGGSSDRTAELAVARGALVVVSSPGRGDQLNAGAQAGVQAGADALLFLHADTRLPAGARKLVADALADGAVGGGFTVVFAPASWLFRVGARWVNLRTRWFRIPLGDQAQFASAAAFERAGGYPAWPILEDLELLARLRRLGKLAVLEPPVTTSARRFLARGIARTIATNWLIWALFALGFQPARLSRLYRKVR